MEEQHEGAMRRALDRFKCLTLIPECRLQKFVSQIESIEVEQESQKEFVVNKNLLNLI